MIVENTKQQIEEASEYYAHNYFDIHETNSYKELKRGFEAGVDWSTKNINKSPIEDLIVALKEDKEYYEFWKANIAMAFVDQYNSEECLGIRDSSVNYHSNRAAERFLKQLINE